MSHPAPRGRKRPAPYEQLTLFRLPDPTAARSSSDGLDAVPHGRTSALTPGRSARGEWT